MLRPRPKGEVAKARRFSEGGVTTELASLERRLLREIVNSADLLDLPSDLLGSFDPPGDRWMLVRAPAWMLDLMAEFETDREDIEFGEDLECEETDGDDHDDKEPDVDDEFSLGATADLDQRKAWWGNTDDEAGQTRPMTEERRGRRISQANQPLLEAWEQFGRRPRELLVANMPHSLNWRRL
jgi:hypothetical protein